MIEWAPELVVLGARPAIPPSGGKEAAVHAFLHAGREHAIG